MEKWQENHREEIVMVDMEQLVPKDHLLRKVEKIMDYKWLYERLSPLYCHDNGRNGTDPVVLIKKEKCGANEKGQKILQTHIWQEYLDIVEQLRKTERGKQIYKLRKESIERVFGDAKEKHAMRYTHHRGLARVSHWVKLKFAAMNLKKLANWLWKRPSFLWFWLSFGTLHRELQFS